MKQLQEAKRLKAQALQSKLAHDSDEDKEEADPEEISSEEDAGDCARGHKGQGGQGNTTVCAGGACERRNEDDQRQGDENGGQPKGGRLSEELGGHAADPGGHVPAHRKGTVPLPELFGDGWTHREEQRRGWPGEARDLRETLGHALCCVVKCSQPVAMDFLGVRAQYAPGAGTARTKLMQRFRLTAAEADQVTGVSALRPYPRVSSAVAADALSYPR